MWKQRGGYRGLEGIVDAGRYSRGAGGAESMEQILFEKFHSHNETRKSVW